MPRFRTGTKVPLNVYDGDEPAFQAHSEHKAAVYVALLNAGERVETITRAELSAVFADSGEWWDDENFLHRLEAEVWALLASRETPPERPVAAPEPPPATGQQPTTYDLTEGQELRQAAADHERALLESIDPRDIMRSAGLPTGHPESREGHTGLVREHVTHWPGPSDEPGQPEDDSEPQEDPPPASCWVRSSCGAEVKIYLHHETGVPWPGIGEFGWCGCDGRGHRAVEIEVIE